MKPKKLLNSTSCPKCRKKQVTSFTYSDVVDFRNLELDVENLERSRCEACDAEWETSEQAERNQARVKRAYGIARDKLRVDEGLLTGQEISEIRERLGINQREAAALFGGGPNSFNKYESGEVLQSFAMDRLIRIAGVLGKRAIAFLRNVHAPHHLLAATGVTYVLEVSGLHPGRDRSITLNPLRAHHVAEDFQLPAMYGRMGHGVANTSEALQNLNAPEGIQL
jgi:putative zinc finger/helix-turn-helix YgiT family protein